MYNDDDSRKSDEEYMRSLYDRFRREVESGASMDYYEINELLDIYDYAQDEGDAMVQMFVFLAAARLYPDNHDFDERMAFFLSYVSQDAANDMISRGGRQESALWDVLRMGVKCYPAEDPTPYLDDILEKYDALDCESVLKIIDLLRDMDRRDLLAKYYPAISKRAEDQRGLAFEVAETLKERGDFMEEARKVADDLTKLEPFNIEAWLLLARIEFGLERPEEALAAVDYALAIDPEHFNARLTRGVIMVVMPDKRAESISILKGILESEPLNNFALEGLAEAYVREGRTKDACDIYATMIRNDVATASNVDPLSIICELAPDNLEEYLQLAINHGKTDSETWRAMVAGLLDKEKFAEAGRAVDYYYRNVGITTWVDFYLHTLYDAGMLARYAEVFEEVSGSLNSPGSRPGFFTLTDYILLAAVYLRLGRKEDAAALSEAIEKSKEKAASIDDHFRKRGIRLTARLIHTLATTDDLTVNLKNFDPLTIDFLP